MKFFPFSKWEKKKMSKGIQRNTTEYYLGRDAYKDGLTEEDCPYEIGQYERTGWFVGFFDARSDAKFGPFIEIYEE